MQFVGGVKIILERLYDNHAITIPKTVECQQQNVEWMNTWMTQDKIHVHEYNGLRQHKSILGCILQIEQGRCFMLWWA